ncbi:MAG: O-antigen ligase family protein [Candidatus Omnitrophica bacterium]|nr:O-antigen ligase family protein [Candidatus Omnitrophota bacterium]
MRTYPADLKIEGAATMESPQQIDRGFLTLPFIILVLCMVPDLPGLAITKIPVALLLLCLSFPAVLAAFTGKISVIGRGIFLAFLLVTVLNLFNCLVYRAPLLRWMRIAFCSYTFAAMFFFIVQKINTPNRRAHLWRLIVIFASLSSFFDFITVAKYGLAETFAERAAGGQGFQATALMLIFPVLGTALVKKKWLLVFFIGNLFLLLLTASRGVYLLLIASSLYTLFFIQKRFTYRLAFLLFVIMIGAVLVNTPVYNRMSNRFSRATTGEDPSVQRRINETRDSIAAASHTWMTLIFGKGFGIPWKVQEGGELPGGYMENAPHNDYAARFLYCGLLGLVVQLLLYFVVASTCFRALKRARGSNIDVYTKVRLHGALLVLLSMVMAGFAGGIFLFLKNNVFQAFIFGMGMADATEILWRGRGQGQDNAILNIK